MAELLLNIPDEFFPNTVSGKKALNDCFERVFAELQGSSEYGNGIGYVVGRYELETLAMLQKAIEQAEVLSEHGKLIDTNNGKYMFDYAKENPTYTGKDVEGALNSMTGVVPPSQEMQTITKEQIQSKVNHIMYEQE